jgi:hypothetical protein
VINLDVRVQERNMRKIHCPFCAEEMNVEDYFLFCEKGNCGFGLEEMRCSYEDD